MASAAAAAPSDVWPTSSHRVAPGAPLQGCVALLLHANAMVLDDMSDWAQFYLSLGVSVMMLTFWGYPDPDEDYSQWAGGDEPGGDSDGEGSATQGHITQGTAPATQQKMAPGGSF